jgi:hypothetical protein
MSPGFRCRLSSSTRAGWCVAAAVGEADRAVGELPQAIARGILQLRAASIGIEGMENGLIPGFDVNLVASAVGCDALSGILEQAYLRGKLIDGDRARTSALEFAALGTSPWARSAPASATSWTPAHPYPDPAGPRRAWAGAQPPVGVPAPIAIAKMCSAVIPLPTPALTVGSVTDATVLPACSGTDAK